MTHLLHIDLLFTSQHQVSRSCRAETMLQNSFWLRTQKHGLQPSASDVASQKKIRRQNQLSTMYTPRTHAVRYEWDWLVIEDSLSPYRYYIFNISCARFVVYFSDFQAYPSYNETLWRFRLARVFWLNCHPSYRAKTLLVNNTNFCCYGCFMSLK